MNDHADEPDSSSDSSTEVPASRCDDYEDYLEDAYGYAYAARDIVPLRELESHDALFADPEAGLGGRSVDDLNDFELLGRARGFRERGDIEAFRQTIERVFGANASHGAVDYAEVHLLAALACAEAGDVDEARRLLETCAHNWPDMAAAAGQTEAVILMRADRLEEALATYDRLADNQPDDPEMFYEFAEDLVDEGYADEASPWLDRAAETAERVGDGALSVDIRLLRERIAEATGE